MRVRLTWLATAIALTASGARADNLGWLITPEEVSNETAWIAAHPSPPTFRMKAYAPGQPTITMVSPDKLDAPLKAPFPIQVSFKAKDGATIKPESFKALYGFLKIDITERLTGKAKVTPEGINVENANIPSGNHRLVLRVSDSEDRQGETELRFTVE